MKIGIMGGSFSPITNLHLITAETVIDELNLDQVILEPVNKHYIKKNIISDTHRLLMCSLATREFGNKKITTGIYESTRTYSPKTYETAKRYKEAKNADVFVIMGSDNLISFDKYSSIKGEFIEELFSEMKIVAVNRDGVDANYIISKSDFLKKHKKNIRVVEPSFKNNISSSLVRDRIQYGKTIRGLVSNSVVDYIEREELYR